MRAANRGMLAGPDPYVAARKGGQGHPQKYPLVHSNEIAGPDQYMATRKGGQAHSKDYPLIPSGKDSHQRNMVSLSLDGDSLSRALRSVVQVRSLYLLDSTDGDADVTTMTCLMDFL